MAIAYLNGDFLPLDQARISPLDRGFLFADGIYEVIPAYGGVPFRLTQHLERLERSLAEIQLTNPLDRAGWTALFKELLARNGGGNLSIYLQITRGVPERRDHAFPPPEPPVAPTVFAMTSPIATPAASMPETAPGAKAIVLDDIRWARCDIKTTALLANVLMRQEAVSRGCAEAILVRDGVATEGSASNLFIVRDGVVVTPPKDHRILPGITRDLVLELCRAHDVPVEESDIPVAALRNADEVWLSSSTKELVPVVELDGQTVGDGRPGPLWKKLARLYVDYKRELCGAT